MVDYTLAKKVFDTLIAMMEEQENQHREEIAKKNMTIEALELELDDWENGMESPFRVAKEQAHVEAHHEAHDCLRCSELEAENRALKDKVDKMQEEYDTLDKLNDRLCMHSNSKGFEVDDLENENIELQKRIEHLECDKKEADAKIKELEKINKELIGKIPCGINTTPRASWDSYAEEIRQPWASPAERMELEQLRKENFALRRALLQAQRNENAKEVSYGERREE